MANDDKNITIYVEATPHSWPKNSDICYAQVVKLEFPDFVEGGTDTYSVKYKRGDGNKPEGVLAPGGCEKVKDGMIFNVSKTGQS